MWISKKKWQTLEKRVADLEGQVQSQLNVDIIKKALQNLGSIEFLIDVPAIHRKYHE